MRLLILSLLLALMVPIAAQAGDIVVVAGPESSIDDLAGEEVRKLFLGQSNTDPQGNPVTLYDLDDRAIRGQFYRAAASMSLVQLRAYWAKMVFTGHGRPPRQLGVEELIERLKTEREALGYLPRDMAEGLTIIYGF